MKQRSDNHWLLLLLVAGAILGAAVVLAVVYHVPIVPPWILPPR
jgi:hypothetical protein